MRSMVIEMNDEQLKTLADLQGFLEGTVTMDFAVAAEERYGFIARTVKRFGYGRLKRSDKAIVLRFLERVSGYSRQQIGRLVKRGGERRAMVKRYCGSRTSFARTYRRGWVAVVQQCAQCALAGMSRATFYAQKVPRLGDELDLLHSRLIDEEYCFGLIAATSRGEPLTKAFSANSVARTIFFCHGI